VRDAFLQIAASDRSRYHVIDGDQSMDLVSQTVIEIVNRHFGLGLEASLEIA
jgi:thymidylate kinase